MHCEWRMMWKQVVRAYFKILFQNIHVETVENHASCRMVSLKAESNLEPHEHE